MNVIALVGEVVALPEVKESAQGNKFANMKVAVQRPFANSEGIYENDEISCTLWKGIAETTSSVAKLHDIVSIKGRMQSHNYEGRDGNVHTAYDVIAEHVSFFNKSKK